MKTSKYAGVCFRKDRNKWVARVRVNKQDKHLGLFLTEEEAHQARIKFIQKLDK